MTALPKFANNAISKAVHVKPLKYNIDTIMMRLAEEVAELRGRKYICQKEEHVQSGDGVLPQSEGSADDIKKEQ